MSEAARGRFWFDPATLIQRRPAWGPGAAIRNTVEVAHERAHWYQFAGSTIGGLILTMHRAETLVPFALAGYGRPAHRAFRERLSVSGAGGLRIDGSALPDSHANDPLGKLTAIVSFIRSFRTELSSCAGEPRPGWEKRWLFAQLITRATYLVHTGEPERAIRFFNALALPPIDQAPDAPTDPATPSTTHVIEGAARIAEFASLLTSAWQSATPGAEFSGLHAGAIAYVNDRLRADSDLYRRCFDRAFEVWGRPSGKLNDAELLARWFPTLACCFDIAMNPRVGPVVRLEDSDPHVVLPGSRFLRLLDAVNSIGHLDRWPDDSSYAEYRGRLTTAAQLEIGMLDTFSFQHPRFSGKYWAEAETDDLLSRTSYFDYLIWAMERMHAFRSEKPLQWAIPGLQHQRQGNRGADIAAMIDPGSLWIHTPLYWVGDEINSEVRLSPHVAERLLLDVAANSMIRQAFDGRGNLSLVDNFPPAVAGDRSRVEIAREMVIGGTGWTELRDWPLDVPAHDGSPPQEVAPFLTPATVVNLARHDVENTNLEAVTAAFDRLRRQPLESRWSCDLSFDSSMGDPRGLWDIPEVVNFLRAVTARHPDWSWFLQPPKPTAIGGAGFLLCGTSYFVNPRNPSSNEREQFVLGVLGGFNLVADALGLGEEDWNENGHVLEDGVKVVLGSRLY